MNKISTMAALAAVRENHLGFTLYQLSMRFGFLMRRIRTGEQRPENKMLMMKGFCLYQCMCVKVCCPPYISFADCMRNFVTQTPPSALAELPTSSYDDELLVAPVLVDDIQEILPSALAELPTSLRSFADVKKPSRLRKRCECQEAGHCQSHRRGASVDGS
jgi:hypothetical protein